MPLSDRSSMWSTGLAATKQGAQQPGRRQARGRRRTIVLSSGVRELCAGPCPDGQGKGRMAMDL